MMPSYSRCWACFGMHGLRVNTVFVGSGFSAEGLQVQGGASGLEAKQTCELAEVVLALLRISPSKTQGSLLWVHCVATHPLRLIMKASATPTMTISLHFWYTIRGRKSYHVGDTQVDSCL